MSVKAEKTREKILDTALRHFLKDGFSGASLSIDGSLYGTYLSDL